MKNKIVVLFFIITLISINIKNYISMTLQASGKINYINTNLNEYNFIAHAGGGIDGLAYTNTVDAIYNSIENNYRLIELDLLVTDDDMIVASHDWKSFKNYCKKYIEKKESYSYKDVRKCNNNLEKNNEYQLADEYFIRQILNTYGEMPNEVTFVTDQIQDFKLLKKKFKGYESRIIVEAHSILNYLIAKKYFPLVALTYNDGRRYKYFVKFFNIDLIVIRSSLIEKYKNELEEMLKNKKIVFSNTTNNKKFINKYLGKNVTAFYTDFWDIKNNKCTEKIKDFSNNSPCHTY